MTHRAFTLVEVLIVVIILGILAAAVIPQFTEAADDARANSAAIVVKSMLRQIAVQQAKTGSWPATVSATWFEGGTLPTNPLDPNATSFCNIATSAALLHPGTKTIHVAGAFWYNKGNGIIRARVPAQATTAETIALYNAVNGCAVTSLSQTD